MAKLLYISLTGMTEPLGESQVMQYLLDLAKQNSIYLLSFEKPADREKYHKVEKKLNNAGIRWKYYEYSNRYGVLSTGWQIVMAFCMLSRLIKREKIQIVHARSLVPATIGVLLKKLSDTKLLFDIRGFAIDEKIMDGRLKEGSILSKMLKKLESHVYKRSDHIVTLTHASKPIIEEKYRINPERITVIPTCAAVELFKPIPLDEKTALKEALGFSPDDLIILHNGSLNNWVDFDAELKLFQQLAILNINAKFLFLNKGQHTLINAYLEKYHFDKDKYKILAVEFDQINKYLNLADICVFFIKPSFAKQASAPTKFAELISCHIYSATNTNYGDMEHYLNLYRVGILLDLQEVHADPKESAKKIITFINKNKNDPISSSEDFEHLFSHHFSKNIAIKRYQKIYDHLIKECHENITTDQI